jgi:hypothetical protein
LITASGISFPQKNYEKVQEPIFLKKQFFFGGPWLSASAGSKDLIYHEVP